MRRIGIRSWLAQAAGHQSIPASAVSRAPNKRNGWSDYQLSAQALSAERPREAATAIAAALEAQFPTAVGRCSVAGPGFLNISLHKDFLSERLRDMRHEDGSGVRPLLGHDAQRVAVDFSSPNIAKEMHVGHLRSTLIGDTLSRTLEFCGARVSRINHVGDWGTQFGMLLEQLNDSDDIYNNGGGTRSVTDLQGLYREAKARFDADDAFRERARRAVVRLQSLEPAAVAAWRAICDASRAEFERLYERLGVSLHEIGESSYNERLAPLVAELLERGVAREQDGMVVADTTDDSHDAFLILRKSDGGFTYGATDLAALERRVRDDGGHDRLLYVVDAGQRSHFEAVFGVARRAGLLHDGVSAEHVAFGVVRGADGKKFRTRAGESVRLAELLDEARDRAAAVLETRTNEGRRADAGLEAAEQLGVAAVRYFDLGRNRAQDYKFSFDETLDPRGRTAVYAMYTYARMASLRRKASTPEPTRVFAPLLGDSESARRLAAQCVSFHDELDDAMTRLQPHVLVAFAHDLCERFNEFYAREPRIAEDADRVELTRAAQTTLRQTLQLLGITPLEEM